ncbi:ABC transporter substrate-binding protein [Cohnella sp.]|uniref:ABC transporter substrate-binding protein n=1 Tax=Cohnella sp. TaxID=1883426 RepID=UPI0035634EF9
MSISAEKYLMLLNHFGNRAIVGQEIEATAEEVSGALYCSPRNAKIVIHRLAEERLIQWHAGRGRGNVSRIVFLAEKEPFLVDKAQEMAHKGEYKQAFELLHANGAGVATIDRFLVWLNDQFGYRSERTHGAESKDTLCFPMYEPVWTLDPLHVYYSFDAHMIRQVFDRLAEYETGTSELKPGLAHYWESDPEATEWTFYLRKGVRFHHGRELQPEDVRFTFERLRGNKPSSWLARNVKEVICEGPRAVRVVLDQPNFIFPRFVSSAGLSIVPREAGDQDGDSPFWNKPYGTGPFRVGSRTEYGCELWANLDYFQGRAHMDKVVVAYMPKESARLSENAEWRHLLHGRKSILRRSDEDWSKIEALCRGSVLMTWNLGKQGPQQSPDFRRAISLFLNRKQMIRELGEDRIYPARGFRPTLQTPYLNEELDEEEARRLLRKSAYQGEEVVMATYGSHQPDAHWIRRRCEDFGVNLRIETYTHLSVREAGLLPAVDALLFGVVFGVEDVCEIENYEQAGNFLKEHLHPDVQDWITARIDRAVAEPDPQARRSVLDGIEDRLRDESHVLFVLHKKSDTYVHPNVKGVGLNSLGWIDFKDIWLEKRE